MLNARQITNTDAVSAPAAYFAVVQAAFDRAARSVGSIEQFYEFAGYSIRLLFAGPALVPHLTPALAHRLEHHGHTPGLTIYLWDTTSTGVAMPPPPWRGDVYGARGEVIGFNNVRNQTNFQFKDESSRVGAVNLLDHQLDEAVYWIPDARDFPYHERSAPLRMILNWWLERRGYQVIHAAAVGTAAGGVLFAGKGGSGKSTAALACLLSGFSYASDDYVLVCSEPEPVAHSLYSSAKLHGDNIHRLPHLFDLVSNKDSLSEEKGILFLNEHYPKQLMSRIPIRAILLPRVTGLRETTIKRTSGAAALAALAPSSIFQTPGAGDSAFRQLGQLVKQVPSYEILLGEDIARISEVVAKLLSDFES